MYIWKSKARRGDEYIFVYVYQNHKIDRTYIPPYIITKRSYLETKRYSSSCSFRFLVVPKGMNSPFGCNGRCSWPRKPPTIRRFSSFIVAAALAEILDWYVTRGQTIPWLQFYLPGLWVVRVTQRASTWLMYIRGRRFQVATIKTARRYLLRRAFRGFIPAVLCAQKICASSFAFENFLFVEIQQNLEIRKNGSCFTSN